MPVTAYDFIADPPTNLLGKALDEAPPLISAKPVGVGAAYQLSTLAGEESFIADAHRGDGKRFVVRAGEKFRELESVTQRRGGLS